MSNVKHPMSEEASAIEPAEVKATDPDSKYTGRPNYWKDRQQQSGLETKHEVWVMATLNFLQQMQIPFYTYKPNGDRDPKRDKEIPERLKLMQQSIWTTATELSKSRSESNMRGRKLDAAEQQISRKDKEHNRREEVATKIYKAMLTGEGMGQLEALQLLETLTNIEEENDDDTNSQPV